LNREIFPITFADENNSKNEMVGGLKIVQVKPGHEAELERLFAGLRSEMRAHEPGAYIVQEQYRDQAALDFHQKSANGARYFPQMRAIIEKIEAEYFDGIVD
jgi:quinol monooxygenase YgiN